MNHVRLPPGSRSGAARDAGASRGHRRGGRIRPDRPRPRRRIARIRRWSSSAAAGRCWRVRRCRDCGARRRGTDGAARRRFARPSRPESTSGSAGRSATPTPRSKRPRPTSPCRSIGSRNCSPRCARTLRAAASTLVVWGHVSDGNLHPNVIARTREQWLAAGEVVADLGRMAIRARRRADGGARRRPQPDQAAPACASCTERPASTRCAP